DVTPAEARSRALSAAADAARATGAPWLVVPAHERPSPVVVLPMAARDAFLRHLAAAPLPAYLSLRDPADHHRGNRSGPVAAMAEGLRRGRTSVLHLEPWPEDADGPTHLAAGCSVEVQLWEAGPDGSLVAPRRNAYAERLDAASLATAVEVEVDGVTVPTLPLMAEPTVTECRFPVDVVYTWVDGSDPEWDAARQARLAEVTGTAHTRQSSGRARFLDRGELRYSMRSLHLFAPWVRRIHLVTAGQVPAWLDVDHPRVNLVDHRDILPAGALPTFNSHAIETGLHRIDGLTEHFVYLNDDVLLGRPLGPEAFFSPAGQLAVFPSPSAVGLPDQADAAPYVTAALNNRALLRERFGAVTTHHLAHTPHPHRVSVLQELEAAFPDALDATAHAPFRSDTDVSTLSSLAQHFALLTGAAALAEGDLAYVNLSNADVEQQLRQVLGRDQDFLCLGDHHDHALRAERLEELLADFFPRYYPVAAPWER
ncbi:stealth family protein, partial [Nocardioides sp. SYSU DS0663]|uniref:stealth family protein n=1 Tax=Nocardioides sp. SYSU DS0663 TaxID=3416445 RepID=UPI003F4BD886